MTRIALQIPISARSILWMLVVSLVSALPAARAADNIREPEDGWRILPVDESLKNSSNIKRILRSRTFEAGQEKLLVNYYKRYDLPRWSLPENRARLSGFRVLLSRDLTAGRSGPPHDKLSELVLEFMSKLCKDDPARGSFHPAARVNAMLMLGELNAKEMEIASDRPVPMPGAVPIMLEAIADPQQLDAVKVAALGGVVRHATLGGIADAEHRARVAAAMLKLAATDSEPGRSEDGHAWMRSMACEVLGLLGAVGKNNEVPTTLTAIVGDASAPFFLRSKAARSLGSLKYTAGNSFDSAPAALALGRLIVDACKAEEESDDPFRRRLKARLVAADVGLAALPAKPNAKPSPAELKKTLKAMWKLFDDKTIDDAELFAKVKDKVPTLPKDKGPVKEPVPDAGPADVGPADIPDSPPDDLPE